MTHSQAVHIHIPNLYVGGIERWALSLMSELPEFSWSVSVPDGAISHPVGIRDFAHVKVVNESQVPSDTRVTLACWPFSDPRGHVVMVAHGVTDYYRVVVNSMRFDSAVAVSKAARHVFERPDEVEVIANGVELSRMQPKRRPADVRAALSIPSRAMVIGYFGRLSIEKNPLAAAAAASACPGSVALYVGTGLTEQEWIARTREMCDCRFVSPEQVGSIGDFYQICDVCVFASDSEGFGLALAEAWYAGVPVVSTRVGIAAEHMGLVEEVPFQPAAHELAAAVERAISSGASARVVAAHDLVLNHYNSRRMALQWRQYLVALDGNRNR